MWFHVNLLSLWRCAYLLHQWKVLFWILMSCLTKFADTLVSFLNMPRPLQSCPFKFLSFFFFFFFLDGRWECNTHIGQLSVQCVDYIIITDRCNRAQISLQNRNSMRLVLSKGLSKETKFELGFELRYSGDISQIIKQWFLEGGATKVNERSPKRFRIMLWNFQKLFAWGPVGAWSLICAKVNNHKRLYFPKTFHI